MASDEDSIGGRGGERDGTANGTLAGAAASRLVEVTLDERTIIYRNADVEQERRVAIFDLLEENYFEPVAPLPGDYVGPFRLRLRIAEGRLAFDLAREDGAALDSLVLALTPFRRLIRDYFAVCESYFQAIKTASPSQIEAIDMGRRGLHNEASTLLKERLADKIRVDFKTARRLFTLICVLHIK
ncbi:MAG: UPF0262 family protein [Alphaproteobacteria bacterium]|nr:MAG: UPF0262 family protein [Alphaproteobacteria bacterium]